MNLEIYFTLFYYQTWYSTCLLSWVPACWCCLFGSGTTSWVYFAIPTYIFTVWTIKPAVCGLIFYSGWMLMSILIVYCIYLYSGVTRLTCPAVSFIFEIFLLFYETACDYNLSSSQVLLLFDLAVFLCGGWLWMDVCFSAWLDLLLTCCYWGMLYYGFFYLYWCGRLSPIFYSSVQRGFLTSSFLQRFLAMVSILFFALCRMSFLLIRLVGYELYDDLFAAADCSFIVSIDTSNQVTAYTIYSQYYFFCISFLLDVDLIFKLCLALNIFYIILYYLHSCIFFIY